MAVVVPRGPWRLSWDPVFGPFFWGRMLSLVGVWIYVIVAAMVTFEASGSATLVGIVTTVQFAPQLLLTPLAGRLADSGHMGRQIIAGRVVVGVASALLAWFVWRAQVQGVSVEPVVVILVSAVVGVGFVMGAPALQSIVPAISRPGEMGAAMTLNSLSMTGARAVGPIAGAALVYHWGHVTALMAAAAASLAFALIAVLIKLPAGPIDRDVGTDRSFGSALSHVWGDRRLRVLLLGAAGVGVAAEPVMTLGPSLAAHWGGLDLVGVIASAFGIGAVLATIGVTRIARSRGDAWVGCAGLVLMALGLGVTVALPPLPLGLAAIALTGAGMTWGLTGLTIQIQERSPDRLRGRIMAMWFMGFVGTRPIAALSIGAMADLSTLSVALAGTALLTCVLAYAARPRSGR